MLRNTHSFVIFDEVAASVFLVAGALAVSACGQSKASRQPDPPSVVATSETSDGGTVGPPFSNPSGIIQVATGSTFVLGLTQDGRVMGWGSYAHAMMQTAPTTGGGGFGGTSSTNATQLQIPGSPQISVSAISAGNDHACAVTTAGSTNVLCWGNDTYGQIGDGGSQDVATPKGVAGIDNAVDLASGGWFTCARTTSGRAVCWGMMQAPGQHKVDMHTPRELMASGAVALAAGSNHVCVLDTSGSVSCLGSNSSGQIGPTSASFTDTLKLGAGDAGPSQSSVPLPRPAVAIFAGGDASCAKLDDGSMYCWGSNGDGVFATNLPTSLPNDASGTAALGLRLFEPTHIRSLDAFQHLVLGTGHSCGDQGDGVLWCWGANAQGQLGDSTTNASRALVNPVPLNNVSIDSYAISRESAPHHTCASLVDGTVWCWGDNSNRILGNPKVLNALSTTPVQSYPTVPPPPPPPIH